MHGNCIDKNGDEYVWSYRRCVRWMILKPVKFIQKTLWFCGIAVHDPIFGECTPDFNCCEKVGGKAFIRIAQAGIIKKEVD